MTGTDTEVSDTQARWWARSIAGRAIKAVRDGVPLRELFWRTMAVLGYRRLWIFVEPPGLWKPVDRPADVEARDLSADDLEAYCSSRPDANSAEFRRRLERGDRCPALWRGGRVVASRWISTQIAEIEYLGLTVGLAPRVEHQYDAYTAPEERGGRLQKLLTAITYKKSAEMGCTDVFYTIGPENRASLGVLLPSARRVGTLASVRLGPWVLPVVRNGEGYLDDVRPIRRGGSEVSDTQARWLANSIAGRAIKAVKDGVPLRELFWRTMAVLGYRRLWIFVEPPGLWKPVDRPADVQARELSADDLAAYCSSRPDAREAEFRRRLERGDRCASLWRGGRVVASRWISTQMAEIEYLGLTVGLAPDMEHQYDAYTAPDERGGRLQKLLTAITFEKSAKMGCTELFYTVGPENLAMLRVLLPSARRVGTLASVRLGPVVVPIVRGGEGYLGDVRRTAPRHGLVHRTSAAG
ncbi:MAG TPA: hypothetical protein VMR97_05325 [Acidimicrobiales bacterium]|nr:hypothetical protein [Acidimicrobiales bacterium]